MEPRNPSAPRDVDTFPRDRLPPPDQWPDLPFSKHVLRPHEDIRQDPEGLRADVNPARTEGGSVRTENDPGPSEGDQA
jgi:hypothetical protein